MSAHFQIEQRLDYFSYTFISEDQCSLFFSRLYTSIRDCKRGIVTFQQSAVRPGCFEKAETKGEYSFFVRDKKGELLGLSVVFFAASSRDYSIRKISREVANARIMEPVDRFMDHAWLE